MTRTFLWRIASISRSLWKPLSGQRGVVLVAVLWICALIMWFAFQISAETRLQGEDQIHSIRKSQALHLAIGGGYEALARMGQPPPLRTDEPVDLNWQPDGKARIVEYQTGIAVVITEAEDLKVNVNKTGQAQLKQVLERAGADEAFSERIADSILDFIDNDDNARLHGVEKEAYKRAGLSNLPFNGPLTSLDQLLLVPGITHQLFYGFGNQSDMSAADQPEIFKGIMAPAKNSLCSMLTIYGNNVNLPRDSEEETAIRPTTWRPGGIYRILSFGKTANGPPIVGIWLTVRYGGDARNPYKILSRKVL
ncbi:MAG: general secretion pathway protein GspK [Syntrophobacteraceae bacterium]